MAQFMNDTPVMLNGQMHPVGTLNWDAKTGQWQPIPGPAPETNVEGLEAFYTAPQQTEQAPGPVTEVAGAPPKETSATPPTPDTPMWKNPQFWDAAATAAGPVLGALLAPKPAPNVPTLSSPVAGSGAASTMQSVLGGPLPIDPRIMRPFG